MRPGAPHSGLSATNRSGYTVGAQGFAPYTYTYTPTHAARPPPTQTAAAIRNGGGSPGQPGFWIPACAGMTRVDSAGYLGHHFPQRKGRTAVRPYG